MASGISYSVPSMLCADLLPSFSCLSSFLVSFSAFFHLQSHRFSLLSFSLYAYHSLNSRVWLWLIKAKLLYSIVYYPLSLYAYSFPLNVLVMTSICLLSLHTHCNRLLDTPSLECLGHVLPHVKALSSFLPAILSPSPLHYQLVPTG